MVQSTERLSVLLNKLLMNTASGVSPFTINGQDNLESSPSNTSSWTSPNAVSWQANDVVVVIVGGRVANSTAWNVASATLTNSKTSTLSLSLVASNRTTNAFSPWIQVFYGVATGSYSGTDTWAWQDNTTGQTANSYAEMYVLRGSGAPSSYSAFANNTGTGSSVTVGSGGSAVVGAIAFSGETAFTYSSGNPTTTVSYYNLENHDGQQWFDDTPPSTINVAGVSSSGVYGGVVINP